MKTDGVYKLGCNRRVQAPDFVIRQNVQRKANHFMIIRRTQNKFGIKKMELGRKSNFRFGSSFLLLLSKAPYIVLAALLGAGLSLCYFKMMVPPRYTATAKLYITGQETLNLKLLSIRTGTLLTVDYQEVFKTWEIQENAADFQGSESQLLRPEQVEVSNPVGTGCCISATPAKTPMRQQKLQTPMRRQAGSLCLRRWTFRSRSCFRRRSRPAKAPAWGKRLCGHGLYFGDGLSCMCNISEVHI